MTYGAGYVYPWWAEMIGIIISLSSMLWIPGYAVYYTMTTPGTLREVTFALHLCPTRKFSFNNLLPYALMVWQVLRKGVTPVCSPRRGAPPLPPSKKDKALEKKQNAS